jgi:nitrate reductase molybdenum cofactor assembly chaperone
MNALTLVYDSLGDVLNYPYEGYREKAVECLKRMHDAHPEMENLLAPFMSYLEKAKDAELEELYVKTFDVQAICCLDVGYLLFGEDYKRGQFLATIKAMQADHGIDTKSDLADFLPTILKLLTKLNFSDATSLAHNAVVPALAKMLNGFSEKGNVFQYPLMVLKQILEKDYGKCDVSWVMNQPGKTVCA